MLRVGRASARLRRPAQAHPRVPHQLPPASLSPRPGPDPGPRLTPRDPASRPGRVPFATSPPVAIHLPSPSWGGDGGGGQPNLTRPVPDPRPRLTPQAPASSPGWDAPCRSGFSPTPPPLATAPGRSPSTPPGVALTPPRARPGASSDSPRPRLQAGTCALRQLPPPSQVTSPPPRGEGMGVGGNPTSPAPGLTRGPA